jgi:hypothetical protein
VRERLLVGREGFVGLQGHPGIDKPGVSEADVALVQLDVVGYPQRCRVVQRGVGAREIEEARTAPWKIHFAHGFQRHANEQAQPLPFRPDEGIHPHIGRDVVSRRRQGERENQRRHRRDPHAPIEAVDKDFPSVEHSGCAAYNGKGESQ